MLLNCYFFTSRGYLFHQPRLSVLSHPCKARYFQKKGAQVRWVGHPLLDRLQTAPNRETARAALGIPPDQIAVVLLPASRQQEIHYLLPVIFQAAQALHPDSLLLLGARGHYFPQSESPRISRSACRPR